MGLPGSGKTYLATRLAEHGGFRHMNTDTVREELGLRGDYSEATKEQVYEGLFERVERGLEEMQLVVVDATFHQAARRERLYAIARRRGTRLFFIELWASEATVRERITQTRADSDADWQVYQALKASQEPLTAPHLIIPSTNENFQQQLQTVLGYIVNVPPAVGRPSAEESPSS